MVKIGYADIKNGRIPDFFCEMWKGMHGERPEENQKRHDH